MMPQVICFDIDDTLTESKQPLSVEMSILLTALLRKAKVAFVGGGSFEQFKKQLLDQMPNDSEFANLYLLPTSGSALYEYALGEWTLVYVEKLSEDEALKIRDALMEAAESTGMIDMHSPSYGDRIEFRRSQVTLSGLGQNTPLAEKVTWDPDKKKRQAMRAALTPLLPHYDIKIAGASSIDITKHGINKAFGVRKLSEHLHIPISDMLYVGDALFPGGNDEVVKETGIKTQAVKDPAETALVIKALLA